MGSLTEAESGQVIARASVIDTLVVPKEKEQFILPIRLMD
jgi:hypothetical protein